MLWIKALLNIKKNGKNEFVTKYVVEHVPQQKFILLVLWLSLKNKSKGGKTGRILYDHGGTIVAIYAWGIGTTPIILA